ncbi:hypothetical protein ABGB17_25395 [Sphaerisporangium sp. B11E5]|uniref:hypothetical protein n=1 Tax=Sphaerisporangium sp. B11E5 TaxID=3153563 RepID=UPI00325F4798
MTEKHDDSHIHETHDGGGEARPAGVRRPENRPAGARRPENRVRRPPAPEENDPLAGAVDEARRFLGSIQRRIGREIGKGVVQGGVAGLGHSLGQGFGRSGGGDVWSDAVAERHDEEYICRACPVCRLKAARRDAGADVTDHLIAAGGELFAAVRQAVEAVSRPPAPRSSGDTGTRVQHIDLG